VKAGNLPALPEGSEEYAKESADAGRGNGAPQMKMSKAPKTDRMTPIFPLRINQPRIYFFVGRNSRPFAREPARIKEM
jgi:hypothetical protein